MWPLLSNYAAGRLCGFLRTTTSAISRVCFLVLTLSTLSVAGVNIPDWVRQAAAQPLRTYPPETNAVVLLDQTDLKVLDSGDYVEHSRHVVKILRPDGRDERDLRVYLEQKDKLNLLHAWTIDSAGREYEIKEKEFIEAGPYAKWVLYSDIRFRSAEAAAPLPGSVIAFEYEVRRSPWFNQITLFLQDQNPVRQSLITLSLPAGWEFKASWSHTPAIQPTEFGPNQWKWMLPEFPGFEKEPLMPPVYVLAPRVAVAYFRPGQRNELANWDGMGRWYTNLVSGRRDPTPEIQRKTAELLIGKADFDSKLKGVTEFLQSEIRYVAVEIGIGGYQPHPAAEIFRERYGDCKDKATLLSSMLRQAGIQSDYILIDSDRGFVNPDLPSLWFNHAILGIELPPEIKEQQYKSTVTNNGKRYIIFDPTDEYTPVGSLRAELQDSYALLVTDSGGELIRTPLLPAETNSITRTGHFVLTADGGLAGEVSEDRGGDYAMRERTRMRNWDERERTRYFEHWLGRSIQGFTLQSMDIQHATELQHDVLIKYKFSTPQYAQQRGLLTLVRPRVLGEISTPVEHKPRHYPIKLEQTTKETDHYEIEIPKDYKVDDVPDPVNIDVGFASYRSKIEVDGSKLDYSREYLVRDLSVPPEKFTDWVKLQGLIGADETAAVVLKHAQ